MAYEKTLHRAMALAAFFGVLVLLGFPRVLEPSPSGMGTHEQIGMPACNFYRLFHIPCPACGGTTAFAEMSRGHFQRALRANIFSSLLYGLLFFFGLDLLGFALLQRSCLIERLPNIALPLAKLLSLLIIASWLVKLYLFSQWS